MKFKIVEEVKKVKPEDFGIMNYKFRPDGTLDVFKNVNLEQKNLTELPFKFGKVDGDFWCQNNNLKSLKGCPKIINGDFYCYHNNLKSLKGLNLDGISGEIDLEYNTDLKLTERQKLWATLNPGRLIL